MTIVNLVSDEAPQEIIELLSSSPPRSTVEDAGHSEFCEPHAAARCAPAECNHETVQSPTRAPIMTTPRAASKRRVSFLASSSPLFEHERQIFACKTSRQARTSGPPSASSSPTETPVLHSTNPGAARSRASRETGPCSNPASPSSLTKNSMRADSHKSFCPVSDESHSFDKGCDKVTTIVRTEPDSCSSNCRNSLKPASREATLADPIQRPRAKIRKQESQAETPTMTAVASVSVSDRRKAAGNLTCYVWSSDDQWARELKENFSHLDAAVSIVMKDPLEIEGLSAAMSVVGTYNDEWNSAHQTFTKAAKHDEDLGSVVIVLKPEYMDLLGSRPSSEREEYFDRIRDLVSHHCSCDRVHNVENYQTIPSLLLMVPEIGLHFKRQVDKFNRAMRRQIASQSQIANYSPSNAGPLKKPSQEFYTNLEIESQIVHKIHAYYPHKRTDCVEMIANCIIDCGFHRYQVYFDQNAAVCSGSIRSKSLPREITIESLTKIQGLPPRIAATIANEIPNIGKLQTYLGSNMEMRASRLTRFGKGNWNTLLIKFLELDNPGAVL